MRFPIGTSDFKELIEGEYLFADKTLMIKDIVDDSSKVIVITRPRRFGKTLNLSMLYYFFGQNNSENQDLFEGLNISKNLQFCEEHQHRYPVIFISFKDIKESNFTDAYAGIVELIRRLYAEHRYLLEGNLLAEDEKSIFMALLNQEAKEANVKGAVQQLSEYITRKFKQPPIILIDEYDTPIQEAYLRNYYAEMISLMRGILGHALKDNNKFTKAIVTGITRIAQESLFSGVNNITIYSILREEYGQYFGLTEEEVLKLLAQSKQTISIEVIKEWYNGYQVGKYILYNPWSIINCLHFQGELRSYWVYTSSNELIAKLLLESNFSVKQNFEELIQGKIIERPIAENLIFSDLSKREEALWSLLLYTGYLKVISSELKGFEIMAKLAIPNKEISFVYGSIILGWFSQTIGRDFYIKFLQSLVRGQMDEFKVYLSDYIMETLSFHDFHKNTSEQLFHIFVLGLIVGLKDDYYIESNRESGFGRFDILLMPKNKEKNAIIFELKTSANAEELLGKAQEALAQIKDRKYIENLKQYKITSILAIGIAFCGKQLVLVHEDISLC